MYDYLCKSPMQSQVGFQHQYPNRYLAFTVPPPPIFKRRSQWSVCVLQSCSSAVVSLYHNHMGGFIFKTNELNEGEFIDSGDVCRLCWLNIKWGQIRGDTLQRGPGLLRSHWTATRAPGTATRSREITMGPRETSDKNYRSVHHMEAH